MTTGEFWIDSRRRHLHVATDGELVALTPPLHFRCRPGALNVIVPRGNLPA
jgi:diacylglycerol kinase family enzyme